jgi:hypothetical protein
MNAKTIEKIGQLLYGTRFVSEFSRALGVSRVSVLAWMSPNKKDAEGKAIGWHPSEDNVTAIKSLAVGRIEELKAALKKLANKS